MCRGGGEGGACSSTADWCVIFIRVPTAQEIQGKWPAKFPVWENREFGNLEFVKTKKTNFVGSSCKFPDPLGKRYCDICASLSFRSWISLPSEFCVCINIVTNHVKLTQVKFAVRQGNVENLKLQFEWGPCFIYCAPIFTQ